MQKIKKIFIIFFQRLKIGSAIAPIIVKIIGKHKEKIHPKHLIVLEKRQWYDPWIKTTDSVLDIGCGNGQRAILLSQKAKSVTGFDISKKNIDLANKEAKNNNIKNINFIVGDAEKEFKFNNRSFDIAFFCDVIEHLNNDDHSLKEINRILKNKGILLLIAPNSQTSWKITQKKYGLPFYSDQDHKREYTKKEITEKLKKHQFRILKISPVVYDTPFSGIIDVVGGFSLSLYKKLSLWKLNYAQKHPEESIGFRIIAQKT